MGETLLSGQTTSLPPQQQDAGIVTEPDTPLNTMQQFFESFHAVEAREEIRQLCQLAVTTDNSTYNTGQKRSNVLYFGEKLEALLEACSALTQKPEMIPKHGDAADAEPDEPEEYDDFAEPEEPDDDDDHVDPADEDMPFDRQPLLTEYLPEDPDYVLEQVFANTFLYDFREDFMPRWLKAALINGNSAYAESEEREALVRFYDALLPLIEALHCINEQNRRTGINTSKRKLPPELDADNDPKLLSDAEVLNPFKTVRTFCREYPLVYVRRELWCFMLAGATYEKDDTELVTTDLVLELYEQVLALVESAFVLCGEEE